MPIIAGQEPTQLDGHLWHILLLVAWIPIFALLLLYGSGESTGSRRLSADPADAPSCELASWAPF